jgi:V8-like Glu-specific endopeptidase
MLPLDRNVPHQEQRVSIIQHPGGQPKQIAMQGNRVLYSDERILQYLTATNPGSSGSPVLNDSWEVCALHHAGGRMTEPATGRIVYRNEGILVSAILDHLPAHVRGRIGKSAR